MNRPKRTKYDLNHDLHIKNNWKRAGLSIGKEGTSIVRLIGLYTGRITEEQWKTIILGIKREIKSREVKIKIGVRLNRGRTSKGLQSKMGKGKGSIESYYGRVVRGSKIIELETTRLNGKAAIRALKKVKAKLGQGGRIEVIR